MVTSVADVAKPAGLCCFVLMMMRISLGYLRSSFLPVLVGWYFELPVNH